MPITLITGTPGAGKSLFAVKKLIEEVLPTGRPVYTNINGFQAPGFSNLTICGPEGPVEWQSYPDGSFCVFDEVQDQYPFKNGMAVTPPYIRGYEKHRHQGKDFIFITQDPRLLDRHLYGLIDHHYHVYRPFGFKRARVMEWQGVNEKPQPLQSATNAARRNFNFPKKYFEHYKSATVHTVKVRFPWRLFGFLGGVGAFLCFVAWQIIGSTAFFMGATDGEALVAAAAGANSADGSSAVSGPCVSILAVSRSSVRLLIDGRPVVLRPDAVAVADGVLTVGGDPALAWPLCV